MEGTKYLEKQVMVITQQYEWEDMQTNEKVVIKIYKQKKGAKIFINELEEEAATMKLVNNCNVIHLKDSIVNFVEELFFSYFNYLSESLLYNNYIIIQ